MRDSAFWLGLWGAILSTLLATWEVRRSRRRLKVKCSFAAPMLPGEGRQPVPVSVVNNGHRPVVVTMAGSLSRDGELVVPVGNPLGGDPPPTHRASPTPHSGSLPSV